VSHLPKRTSSTAILANFLPQLSAQTCDILPECDEKTVSDEIAKRLNTTVQGAHLWLLSPFLAASVDPLFKVAEQIVVDELIEANRLGVLASTVRVAHVSTPRIDRVKKRLMRTVTARTRAIFAREKRSTLGLISRRSKQIIEASNALERK